MEMLSELEMMIVLEEELTCEEFDLFMDIYYHNISFEEVAEEMHITLNELELRNYLLLEKIKEILF